MRLWVVRHGESGWNRAGRLQGRARAAPGLTEKGRAEAEAAAAVLSDTGARLVLASGLARALETGTIIARRLGVAVQVEPRLEERCLGAAEGHPVKAVAPSSLGVANGFVVDQDAAPAGGESVRQLRARVAGLVAALGRRPMEPGIVLATHGGIVRAFAALAAGDPPEAMRWGEVANASVVEVELDRVGGLSTVQRARVIGQSGSS